ncbi:hypothetical protein NPIL_233721 [Nephila pilipes]|uniref:Uncharacterized protein n=1 Tax=Nephila pilipes TaxID=299642 RepID=A0A8X6PVS0_NEPPI|nr:hypothetical protein NPIL_233721 [Nephila pilipes]
MGLFRLTSWAVGDGSDDDDDPVPYSLSSAMKSGRDSMRTVSLDNGRGQSRGTHLARALLFRFSIHCGGQLSNILFIPEREACFL